MGESTIEWTDGTWNPVTGCSSVGAECLHCYARTLTNRYKHNPKLPKYRKGFDVVVEHPNSLKEPYKWAKPSTIFVNSMSDLFHKDVSLDFIKKVFKVMNETPQHTYQVLTKRDHLLKRYSKDLVWSDNIPIMRNRHGISPRAGITRSKFLCFVLPIKSSVGFSLLKCSVLN